MGICMATSRNSVYLYFITSVKNLLLRKCFVYVDVCQPSDSTDINANNSWTRQQSAEWHRHTARKMGNRTISEPIMVVDASVIKSFAPVNDDDSNTISFKRPPKVPLVIQRTISGHDIYDAPDIPIIFVLGILIMIHYRIGTYIHAFFLHHFSVFRWAGLRKIVSLQPSLPNGWADSTPWDVDSFSRSVFYHR